MTVKLSSTLPASDEANGLGDFADSLVSDPHGMHVAVVVLDCARVTTDTDTGEATPTARVRRIEVIETGEDKDRLRALAQRAFEKRTGKTVLPLDLEDELRAAFGGGDDGSDEA